MKIAVIRIGGQTKNKTEVESTFKMLNLPRKFSCTVLEETPIIWGMIKKIKDQITYGKITDETLALLKKREEKGRGFYRLHPPIGGFEKKGTKRSFKEGGALGDRGEKIKELIKKMV